ncbi:hypothetical protein LguiB_023434 [Lonicera macranthoides]
MVLLSNWKILTSVSPLSLSSKTSSTFPPSPSPSPSRSRCRCRLSNTTATTSAAVSDSAALVAPSSSSSSFSSTTNLEPRLKPKKNMHNNNNKKKKKKKNGAATGVEVPRQKYIFISKSELLNAILLLFDSQPEIDQLLMLSSCLDSILHAEHKIILEEMRIDYDLTHSNANGDGNAANVPSPDNDASSSSSISEMEEFVSDNEIEPNKPLLSATATSVLDDFRYLLGSSPKNVKSDTFDESRVAVATRFQRAFVQLLYNAQFEELSAADLMLTSALNTDYLLTLPINVDWKRASESKAIIYRRGFATERQKGLLIAEKLDYLQSKLLQRIFFIISKPLRKVGVWLTEALKRSIEGEDAEAWVTRIKLWLKEMPLVRWSYPYDEQMSDNMLGVDQLSDKDLPIWIAAQRAVSRYEGILSSVGPRGRLIRKLLTWIGFIPPIPENPSDLESEITASESYLRPIFLPRISLTDIWEPATRKFCGNDIWKMFKSAISILSSKSILQEPAFQELILLYTEEMSDREIKDQSQVPSLQLKIYEKIPIPDLPVIFPHKKLSFRILDTVRLDVASILGLLAYFINYKFEDLLSSPYVFYLEEVYMEQPPGFVAQGESAIYLDVIAISALVIYVTRIVLGYKQTWDRYQLLVNRTLYEKTVASGFGSVHFLLDASGQQQYKEAILAYAILLKEGKSQVTCRRSVGDKCEKFMYDSFKAKVEMPVDKAMDTLARLGLVTEAEEEVSVDGKSGIVSLSTLFIGLRTRDNFIHGP